MTLSLKDSQKITEAEQSYGKTIKMKNSIKLIKKYAASLFQRINPNAIRKNTPSVQKTIPHDELVDLKFRIQMARISGVTIDIYKKKQPLLLQGILHDIDRVALVVPRLAVELKKDLFNRDVRNGMHN